MVPSTFIFYSQGTSRSVAWCWTTPTKKGRQDKSQLSLAEPFLQRKEDKINLNYLWLTPFSLADPFFFLTPFLNAQMGDPFSFLGINI
jgi:hypothetical protein